MAPPFDDSNVTRGQDTTVDTSTNIRKLVDEAIAAGCRGPEEIAEFIEPHLDGMMMDDLIEYGLKQFIADALRRHRSSRARNRAPGRSKYEQVREVIAENRFQVETADGWKPLRDCDTDDLAYVRDSRHELARRNTEAAHRYETLRQRLIDERKQHVRDLDPDVVIGIMGEELE